MEIQHKINHVRNFEGRMIFTLQNPFVSHRSAHWPHVWNYPQDRYYREDGVLWYHGQGPLSGRKARTGYIIKKTAQNMQVIDKARRYLVDYKDTVVRELIELKGLGLTGRCRDP